MSVHDGVLCVIMTKPLQVYVGEHELDLLDSWARKRGWTKSQAVRAAIRLLTRDQEEDPLMKACGMIDGLPADFSNRVDDYLEETFIAEKPTPRYRKTRRSR
jgi:hypothetical protein